MIQRLLSSSQDLFARRQLHPLRRLRLHVPAEFRRELASYTRPTENLPEALALMRIRFAAESERNVSVGVGVLPFPNEAYVGGTGGANFSTKWLVRIANTQLRMNCGLVLVHRHGGRGKPSFSSIDARTNRDVMARLSIGVDVPYGALVLSDDEQTAVIAMGGKLRAVKTVIVPELNVRGCIE